MALIEARNELGGEADPFIVNARLATGITGMLNVLDCVAAYCQEYYTEDNHIGDCCFFGYPFSSLQVEFIQTARTRIESLKFNDAHFNAIANDCKHRVPWWGIPSTNPDGFRDIIDGDGVQMLRDVAASVYKQTTTVLEQLAATDCGLLPLKFPAL
jgi:hypothetical protein